MSNIYLPTFWHRNDQIVVKSKESSFKVYFRPRRDFAQNAKSRGGTLVTRTYIKKSIYSYNIRLVYARKNLDLLEQARGREESVGNDDFSIVCARKYEMARMT